MVNFTDVIASPFKLATAGPTLLLNLCTGKTDMSDLNPCSKNSSTTNTNQQFSSPLKQGMLGGKGKNTKFMDYPWNKLPVNARKAATTLGYDESTWAKDWAPAEDKWWEDLNTSEREAALKLGWDQSAWDGKYNDKDFEELPSHVQKAVQSLGFTSQSWNNDEWPSSLDKWWNQFNNEQKKALNTIGYNEYDWE